MHPSANGPTTDYLNDNPEVFKSEKPFLNKRKKEVLADRIQIGGANGMIRIERDNKGKYGRGEKWCAGRAGAWTYAVWAWSRRVRERGSRATTAEVALLAGRNRIRSKIKW